MFVVRVRSTNRVCGVCGVAWVALYYLVYFSFIVQALLLSKEHYSTRNGLVFCLLYRVIPALTIQFVVGR